MMSCATGVDADPNANATRSAFAGREARAPVRSDALASSHCSIGTTKATVFPVPVAAHAIMSCPASASGMTAV